MQTREETADMTQRRRGASDREPTVAEIARWPASRFVRWLALILMGALAARGGDVIDFGARVVGAPEVARRQGLTREEFDEVRVRTVANMQDLAALRSAMAQYQKDIEDIKKLSQDDRVASRERDRKIDTILGILEGRGITRGGR